MHRHISLSAYVKKRNGLPLGASGSMRNMFQRSLGAESFYIFWRYWNPIWGYYLSRNVMRPSSVFLPIWLATVLTFTVSGGLHDLAVSLVKWRMTFFFTPWFVLMSGAVFASKHFNISFKTYPWSIRALVNMAIISVCLYVTIIFERLYT